MDKSISTQELICAGMKELMKEKPLEKIAVKEITDRAGVKRSVFYKHFADKYQAADFIFNHEIIEPMLPLMNSGLIREGILFMLTRMGQDFELYRREIRRGGQNSFRETLHSAFLRLFLPLLEKQLSRPAHQLLTPLNMAEYCCGIFEYVLVKWLSGEEKLPVDALMQVYDLIMLNSIEDMLRGELT